MKFKILSDLFSELEGTSKRLEMIDLLANFFRKIKETSNFEDINKIVYLLQGQLTSNIQKFPKMGLAERMLIQALSLHTGIKNEKIKELVNKKGDIGAAAEVLLSHKKKQKSLMDFGSTQENENESIEISELYSALQKIATTEGAGSQDTKLGILRGLMNKLSPTETKYLLRIILSTLRVGVSTQSIIDGLALGFTESKSNRDKIEHAFNLYPDLGKVTKVLAEKGIEAVEKIDITYGVPIRNMLASRVPYQEIIGKLGSPCVAEYKLDGERLQVHKERGVVKLFSRRLLEVSEQYPDVCELAKANIKGNKFIVEGEVVAMDPFYEKMLPFQVLSKRRRKYDIEVISKEVPVCLFVFDLLKYEEESYINKPLPIRREKLEEIVIERDEIRLVDEIKIYNTEELVEYFNKARKEGNEGIMAKSIKPDSFYQAGNRGFLWIKLKGLEGGKLMDSIDVVIIGANYGKGRRTGVYGTYIVAVYDPELDKYIAFTRVATGLTDEILESLTRELKHYKLEKQDPRIVCEDEPDVWFKPEMVIEIIGDEITISDKFSTLGYSMRFPVFERFRVEKSPKDITTVTEIKNLYQNQ
ncbi:MAG: ATP-dependent DNA ligase [Promethearchaeota archaeon]